MDPLLKLALFIALGAFFIVFVMNEVPRSMKKSKKRKKL